MTTYKLDRAAHFAMWGELNPLKSRNQDEESESEEHLSTGKQESINDRKTDAKSVSVITKKETRIEKSKENENITTIEQILEIVNDSKYLINNLQRLFFRDGKGRNIFRADEIEEGRQAVVAVNKLYDMLSQISIKN